MLKPTKLQCYTLRNCVWTKAAAYDKHDANAKLAFRADSINDLILQLCDPLCQLSRIIAHTRLDLLIKEQRQWISSFSHLPLLQAYISLIRYLPVIRTKYAFWEAYRHPLVKKATCSPLASYNSIL